MWNLLIRIAFVSSGAPIILMKILGILEEGKLIKLMFEYMYVYAFYTVLFFVFCIVIYIKNKNRRPQRYEDIKCLVLSGLCAAAYVFFSLLPWLYPRL